MASSVISLPGGRTEEEVQLTGEGDGHYRTMQKGEWTAFIECFSDQWMFKELYNECLIFTQSYGHSNTHSHSDGGVTHARRHPARGEQ